MFRKLSVDFDCDQLKQSHCVGRRYFVLTSSFIFFPSERTVAKFAHRCDFFYRLLHFLMIANIRRDCERALARCSSLNSKRKPTFVRNIARLFDNQNNLAMNEGGRRSGRRERKRKTDVRYFYWTSAVWMHGRPLHPMHSSLHANPYAILALDYSPLLLPPRSPCVLAAYRVLMIKTRD